MVYANFRKLVVGAFGMNCMAVLYGHDIIVLSDAELLGVEQIRSLIDV